MAKITLHKVLNKPTVPSVSNGLYMESIEEHTKHIAWRVIVQGNPGSQPYVSVGELSFTGEGATEYTPTASTIDSSATAYDLDPATQWKTESGTVIGAHLGKLYTTPVAITGITLTATTIASDWAMSPVVFSLQGSDDTTDGVDGTWIDEVSVSELSAWTAGETRVFNGPIVLEHGLGLHMVAQEGDVILSIPDEATVLNGEGTVASVLEVEDIAERDALSLDRSVYIKVADAISDPLVNAGWALYYYDMVTLTFLLVEGEDIQDTIALTAEDW